MGKRGPIPKRDAERAGHQVKADRADKAKVAGKVKRPPVVATWSALAKSWYLSLADSGQSRFFEPSDWHYAKILAQLLTDELKKARRSSEMMKAILSSMDNLGTTEGARRRMRIEIERVPGGVESDPGREKTMAHYRGLQAVPDTASGE